MAQIDFDTELFGAYNYLTYMAQNAPKGAPKQIFWEMEALKDGDFDTVLDEYTQTLGLTGDSLADYEDPDEEEGEGEDEDWPFGEDFFIPEEGTALQDSLNTIEDGDVEQGLRDMEEIVRSTIPIGVNEPIMPPPSDNNIFPLLSADDTYGMADSWDDPMLGGPPPGEFDYPMPPSDELGGWGDEGDGDGGGGVKAKQGSTLLTTDPDTLVMWDMLDAAYPEMDQIMKLMDQANYTREDITGWAQRKPEEFRQKLEEAMQQLFRKKEDGDPSPTKKQWYEKEGHRAWMSDHDFRTGGYSTEGWVLSDVQGDGPTAGAPTDPRTGAPTDQKTGADAFAATPLGAELDKAPAYSDQFRSIFNALPGSQRFEAQSGIPAMFSDAEMLFYLTEDWSAKAEEGGSREWLTRTRLRDPSLKFEEQDRKDEERVFANWVQNTYLQDPRQTRFGPGFYDNVRGLRQRMLEIKDVPMEDLYDTLRGFTGDPSFPRREGVYQQTAKQANKTAMDRFVFMDPTNSGRLARLVGMYNIHPGTDHWLKAKMMNFYSNMMTNWQASGRNSYDFIEAFVKDRPAMPSGGVPLPTGDPEEIRVDDPTFWGSQDTVPPKETEAQKGIDMDAYIKRLRQTFGRG